MFNSRNYQAYSSINHMYINQNNSSSTYETLETQKNLAHFTQILRTSVSMKVDKSPTLPPIKSKRIFDFSGNRAFGLSASLIKEEESGNKNNITIIKELTSSLRAKSPVLRRRTGKDEKLTSIDPINLYTNPSTVTESNKTFNSDYISPIIIEKKDKIEISSRGWDSFKEEKDLMRFAEEDEIIPFERFKSPSNSFLDSGSFQISGSNFEEEKSPKSILSRTRGDKYCRINNDDLKTDFFLLSKSYREDGDFVSPFLSKNNSLMPSPKNSHCNLSKIKNEKYNNKTIKPIIIEKVLNVQNEEKVDFKKKKNIVGLSFFVLIISVIFISLLPILRMDDESSKLY